MKEITAPQYAEIITNKVAHLAKTIADKDGREMVDTDFSAAMIMTFAQEMSMVMNQVSLMSVAEFTTILH